MESVGTVNLCVSVVVSSGTVEVLSKVIVS